MAELVDRHSRYFIAANVKKGTSLPPAIKIPRPHRDGQPDEPKDPLRVVRMLAGMSRIRYAPGRELPPASSN